MKLRNLIALGILGVLTLGVGVGLTKVNDVALNDAEAAAGDEFVKLTSTDVLNSGDVITIVSSNGYVMTSQNSKYRNGVQISISDRIVSNGTWEEITIESSDTANMWNLHATNITSGYLILNKSDNALYTGDTPTNDWSITISEDGSASIVPSSYSTRKLVWNNSSPRFACYTSNQTSVYIYRKSESTSDVKPTSISVAGDLTQKDYYLNDNWNLDGLTVTILYDDGSNDVFNESNLLNLYLSVNPATANNVLLTSITITPSIDDIVGNDLIISGIKVTERPVYTKSNYVTINNEYIIATDSLGTGNTNVMAKDGQSTYRNRIEVASTIQNAINYSDNMELITIGGVQGAYTLQLSNKQYLSYSGSGNSVTVSDNVTTNNQKWDIVFGSNGDAIISNCAVTSYKLQYNAKSPRFACYSSNQTEIYLYSIPSLTPTISLNETEIEMTTVSGSQTLIATVYNSTSTVNWSKDDANNVVSLNSTVGNEINVSPTGNVGTATITASILENEIVYSASVTINVVEMKLFELVEDINSLTAGSEVIIGAVKNDVTYAIGQQNTSNRAAIAVNTSGTSIILNSNVCTFIVGKGLENTQAYTFMDGNGYLSTTTSVNDNELTTSQTISSLSEWSITIESGAANIASTGKTSRNILKLNLSSDIFACYTSGQLDVSIYKSTSPINASRYADAFLGGFGCNNGNNMPNKDAWQQLGILYSTLSAEDKAIFETTISNDQGTNIERCVSRYDYVIAKYGTADFANFMNRQISNDANTNSNLIMNDLTTIYIIIAISIISVTCICAFTIVKRHKEI